ncbi:MAG: hypothetical protein H0V93_07070 [Euzebyales bacterium]|nr:hypothetical protein [Euzebyales bacterium]
MSEANQLLTAIATLRAFVGDGRRVVAEHHPSTPPDDATKALLSEQRVPLRAEPTAPRGGVQITHEAV